MELRALYEHLQVRILELIETLDELRASPDYEVFLFAEKDAAVIDTIAAAQREELEKEIEELKALAHAGEREIEEFQDSGLEMLVEGAEFYQRVIAIERNAGPTLLEDERLRVFGDEF